MFARILLALLVALGLVTGAPAFACAGEVLAENCACCPVEETQPCCVDAPVEAPVDSPKPMGSAPVDLKLAVVPVLKVVGEAVERGGFVPSRVDQREGRGSQRTVIERTGILLI